MLLSLLRRMPMMPAPDGKTRWVEVSQLRLPKGGQKFSFNVGGIMTIVSLIVGSCYVVMQIDFNPNSFYARIYNNAYSWMSTKLIDSDYFPKDPTEAYAKQKSFKV